MAGQAICRLLQHLSLLWLQVDKEALATACTHQSTGVTQSLGYRDTIARNVYETLFKWILEECSKGLMHGVSESDVSIGEPLDKLSSLQLFAVVQVYYVLVPLRRTVTSSSDLLTRELLTAWSSSRSTSVTKCCNNGLSRSSPRSTRLLQTAFAP